MVKYCSNCMEVLVEKDGICEHCHQPHLCENPAHQLKPGTILKEKYLVGRSLGEGGFGITYIGRDLTLDMRIAIKEYYPNGFANRSHHYSNTVVLTQPNKNQDFEKDMQRFLSEARILARFSGEEGIVGVRDFFRENGTAYIVMEYLDGVTLKEYIRTRGKLRVDELMVLLAPVMRSLSRVHANGMIHRDISPDNIMVLRDGRLKLLDFGAARDTTGDISLSVMLKPGYAPEEQYRSKGKQGPWTDVYALCATIYKCITGVRPDEALERVFEDRLKAPSALGVHISGQQEKALLRGLNVRAGERYQSIEELQKALQRTDNVEIQQGSFSNSQCVQQPNPNNVQPVYRSAANENKVGSRSAAVPGMPNDYRRAYQNQTVEEVNPEPRKKGKLPKAMILILIGILAVLLATTAVFGSGILSKEQNEDDDTERVREVREDSEENEHENENEDEDENRFDVNTDEDEVAVDPEEAILGSWTFCCYMNAENTGMEGFSSVAGIPLVMTFREDQTVILTADGEGLEKAVAILNQELCDYLVEMLYTELGAAGYTRKEIDERFDANYDMTLAEYAEDYVAELDMYSYFLEFSDESTYTIYDNILELEDQKLTFEINGDTLTILDSDDASRWELLVGELPLDMKRIQE